MQHTSHIATRERNAEFRAGTGKVSNRLMPKAHIADRIDTTGSQGQ